MTGGQLQDREFLQNKANRQPTRADLNARSARFCAARTRRSYRSSALSRRATSPAGSPPRAVNSAWRTSRTRHSSHLASATAAAVSGPISPPRPARIAVPKVGSSGLQLVASPWRKALRQDLTFPGIVFGPVLRLALARLASICRIDVMSELLAWDRFRPRKARSKALKHQAFSGANEPQTRCRKDWHSRAKGALIIGPAGGPLAPVSPLAVRGFWWCGGKPRQPRRDR
ncbi:hypothetical protein ABH991_003427 [Bradyrhizobium ottawaense]|uniref:Uncharacterized protein n=1 Tax=Bradyrhizobium ottawaense TaxID=931866 RepID=A0ABV4G8W9_9BRAD